MKKHLIFLIGLVAFASAALAQRVLINPVQDGDLKIKVNDGGVEKDVFTATGSTGAAVIGQSGSEELNTMYGRFRIQSNNPRLSFYEADAGSDQKLWDLVPANGSLTLRTRTDADATGIDVLSAARSGAISSLGNSFNSGGAANGSVVNGGTLNVFTAAQSQAYLVQCFCDTSACTSRAMSFVHVDNAGTVSAVSLTSTGIAISVSGSTVSCTNSIGGTRSIKASYIRMY